jgi:predicted nucleotidyltransferase
MATRFADLLGVLVDHEVDFIVIGGVALIVHGYPRLTLDLDVCYSRQAENLRRIAEALGPLKPKLRGAPAELPFVLDERTLRNGLNFTLNTALGAIDLLGEVTGVGGYESLVHTAMLVDVHGRMVRVIDLDSLERAKAAAGRAKDLIDLEAIRELKKAKRP